MFEHLADPEPVAPTTEHRRAVEHRAGQLRRRRRALAGVAVVAVLAPVAFAITQARRPSTDVVSTPRSELKPLPSLAAATANPGTPIRNGFVVPSGSRQVGPLVPVGGSWEATFLIDEHGAKAFDAFVAQAAALGFALREEAEAPPSSTPVSGDPPAARALTWSDGACVYGYPRSDGTTEYEQAPGDLPREHRATFVRCAAAGSTSPDASAPTVSVYLEQGVPPGAEEEMYVSHARLAVSGLMDGSTRLPSSDEMPNAPNLEVPDIVGPRQAPVLPAVGESIPGAPFGAPLVVVEGSEVVAPPGVEWLTAGHRYGVLLRITGDPIAIRDVYVAQLRAVAPGLNVIDQPVTPDGWTFSVASGLDPGTEGGLTLMVPPEGGVAWLRIFA